MNHQRNIVQQKQNSNRNPLVTKSKKQKKSATRQREIKEDLPGLFQDCSIVPRETTELTKKVP